MNKYLALTLALTLCLQSMASAATENQGWRKTFLFGYGITNTTQTQTVHIADTPEPGLDNGYAGGSKLYGSTLLGLALEKELNMSFKNSIATVGFEIDYLRNRAINGIVSPMINVSPNFDILKYSYDIHSLALQTTAKYIRKALLYSIDGYIQAGLGIAVNRLSDYHEYAPDDSSAAPMLSPYGNRDTANPALSAGIGLMHQLGKYDAYLSFGYRYFYTGRGRLNKSNTQQTTSSITLSPISYQFLVLSLML